MGFLCSSELLHYIVNLLLNHFRKTSYYLFCVVIVFPCFTLLYVHKEILVYGDSKGCCPTQFEMFLIIQLLALFCQVSPDSSISVFSLMLYLCMLQRSDNLDLSCSVAQGIHNSYGMTDQVQSCLL